MKLSKDLLKKIILSTIVAGAFAFFIINGPLQRLNAHISLEKTETEFSKPLFLGHQQTIKSTNLVEDANISGFGHSLLLNKKKEKSKFGVIVNGKAETTQHNNTQLLEHLKKLFPDAEATLVNTATQLYVDMTVDGEHCFYFESKYLHNDIIGYAGPINIGIVLSEEGNIHSVHHISSQETESYLRKIENAAYYSQYPSLSLRKTSEVDGVSGATITSHAIAETSTSAIQQMFPEPFDNLVDEHQMHKFGVASVISNTWLIHAGVLSLLFTFSLQKWWKKSKKTMTIVRLISLLYLGFFLNNSFTYTSFLHPFMGVTLSSLSSVYIALVLLGAIWGKNVYCKHICPFGNGLCLANQMRPKSWSSKFFISNKWLQRIRLTITLVLVGGIFMGFDNWKNYELFPDLFGVDYLSFWFSVSLLVVLLSIKYPMLWCRALCPTGLILDAVSDLAHKPIAFPRKAKTKTTPSTQKIKLSFS